MTRIVQVMLNAALLNVGFVLAFLARYGGTPPSVGFAPYTENYLFLTCIFLLCQVWAGVFRARFNSVWKVFRNLFTGLFMGTLFALTFAYVFRAHWSKFPSSVFVIQFPISLALMFAVNMSILRYAGRIVRRVIVLGRNGDIEFEQSLCVEKKQIDSIEELLHFEDIDEVLICKNGMDPRQMNLLIFLLLKLKVSVVFSPTVYAVLMSESIMSQESIRFLATSLGRKNDWEEFAIQLLDALGSVGLLILCGPLFLLMAAAVKLSSPGPVFYRQTRIGKNGKPFALYKFRTMIEDAEKHTGPILASETDPRITPLGRAMRRMRIDELPQLVNVLKGDMSLVGPRPEREHFVKRHRALREIRLAVKPGLTGLAQVRNVYGLRPEHKIKYDYLYIQKRSLLLNLYILAKTVPVVFSRRGV